AYASGIGVAQPQLVDAQRLRRRVHAVHHEPDEPRVGPDVDELRTAGVGQVARLQRAPARAVATGLDRVGVDAPGRRGGLRDAVLALVDGQVRDVLRGTL